VTVSVTDPQPTPVTQCTGTPLPSECSAPGKFTFNVLPVRPTSVATVPDDIVPNGQTQNFPITIDGGFFGPGITHGQTSTNFVDVFFQSPANPTLSVDPTRSTSNQLFVTLQQLDINPGNPGLYPLYVASRATNPAPTPSNPSVTNLAIFPDYSSKMPPVSSGTTGISAGVNPSAVDIDSDLGVLVVAETGSNAVEFFSIGKGSLTSLGKVTSTAAAPINLPTGVSVNRTNHTVAVVNYGSQTVSTANNTCQVTFPSPPGQPGVPGQTVTVLPIPGAPPPPPGTPAPTAFSVDLTVALQGSVCPAPMPYSIGVDPDSNLALVAYSSTSSSSASNLGLIVNLNANTADASGKPTNPYGCTLGQAINASSNKDGQCLFAQVTLNTGTYPQVAVAPHGHSALVTPGGSGFVRGVDVTKPSNANFISSATLSGGIVTVIVDTTKCPNGITATGTSKNPCPLLMIPGAAGSVLISGLTPGSTANNAFFNGVFTVNVTSNSTFTYIVPNSTATDSCKPPAGSTSCGGEVFYGSPDQILGLSRFSQGVAINPVTSIAAIADADATGNNGAQINLLNGLDQSQLFPITFSPNCTVFTATCATGSPELLPTADVAWQPFTNSLVSYNPHLNQVSISDPVTHRRYAFACASATACTANPITAGQITLSGGIGAGMVTLTGQTVPAIQNGTTNSLTLFGGLAVDPVTNQAFVVKSGSSTIDIVDLTGAAAIKATHISEVIVPTPSSSSQGSIGGIPNALVPQATLTCTTPVPPATSCDLPSVRILGSGFASPMTVRLDSIDITTQGGTVGTPLNGGREVDVTIPASLLKMPHHYALDVLSNNAQSNSADFLVVQQVDLSNVCPNSSGTPVNTMPTSVAIADQIANGAYSPIALVSVTGCNSVVAIDIAPSFPQFDTSGNLTGFVDNTNIGKLIGSPVSVGTNPQGIAIWQRQGLAVVANNGSNSASILDLTPLTLNPPNPPVKIVPDITNATGTGGGMGTNPTGVAVNEATGAAIVTNTASNTISMINLGLLFPQPTTPPTPAPTTLSAVSIGGIQEPTAVAIDPDRGTNNQGIAVVAAVVLSSGFAPAGELAVVNIGTTIPALGGGSGTASTPTGIVFDPAVNISSANPGVVPGAFFANSSGTNSIAEFIPEGGGGSVGVGINPTSLAINPQTGAMLTANSASNTISIVDTIPSLLKTRQTLGIPGSPTFGVAIDQFTNLAVIVDQANMRVFLFPMPN